MTTATSMNTSGFGGSSFKAPRSYSDGIFSRIALYFHRANVESQLEALDDRMLADIGLARCDIPHVVRDVTMVR